MQIIKHLKSLILKELFDDQGQGYDFEEEDKNTPMYFNKTYLIDVRGDKYQFVYTLARNTPDKFIEFNYKPVAGSFEDMPNDGRAFEVMRKLKDSLRKFIQYLANVDGELLVSGIRFSPVFTKDEKGKNIIDAKRSKLYVAAIQSMFPNIQFDQTTKWGMVFMNFPNKIKTSELV